MAPVPQPKARGPGCSALVHISNIAMLQLKLAFVAIIQHFCDLVFATAATCDNTLHTKLLSVKQENSK